MLEVPAGDYPLSAHLGGTQRVERFWLDRHLVTVARYRRFIEADGYEERKFWSAKGWAFVRERDLTAPRFWDEPKWARFQRPVRPVIGVSWYEADAFARFEGRRLPTQKEWEAAARGPEGRTYPWGDEWDRKAAAVRGEGPRVTWPVGFFKAGRGPFGHYDLVGNVWQWTSDETEPGARDSSRIVKGGSWASRPDQNTTGGWNAYNPQTQHSHVGFRTVLDDLASASRDQ